MVKPSSACSTPCLATLTSLKISPVDGTTLWPPLTLLVAYLFIGTIMLLNLLIAILSTSHSMVHDNVKIEFKVSKARIIEQYRLVVDRNLLPAPFNLVQLVADLVKFVVIAPISMVTRSWCSSLEQSRGHHANLCSDFNAFCPRTALAYGRLIFWAVLGPVAVVTGALLLWTLSSFQYIRPICLVHAV